jgi:predicted Fe-Mo cluster-binding NifX family protein
MTIALVDAQGREKVSMKMKIAVPLFNDRVSPHFGSSSITLLVDIRHGRIEREALWELGGENPLELANRLLYLRVDQLICGGIHSYWKEWLISKGIRVLDNQRGVAREVVEKLMAATVSCSTAADETAEAKEIL